MLGRPTTSDGTPSTSASSATVEFIVTTPSAAARSDARSSPGKDIETFG